MWEYTVEQTFAGKPGAARFDERQFNQTLFARNLLVDDVEEIVQDGVVYLYHQILSLTPKTMLEYKCGYKLMPNMGILVGIDERDFLIPNEDNDFPFEELFNED